MSKFRNLSTQVEVSVSDEKDYRFTEGWEHVDVAKRPTARKKKSDDES